MKSKGTSNLLAGLLFLAIGGFFWIVTPGQVPTNETSLVTARTFPHIALGLIILSSLILLLRGTIQMLRENKESGNKKCAATKRSMELRLWITGGLLILSVVIGQFCGLLVSGLIISNGMLLVYRTKQKWHYLLVTLIVTGAYFLFKLGFRLNLP